MCPPFLEKDTMPGSDFASHPAPPALVYLSDLDVSASLHWPLHDSRPRAFKTHDAPSHAILHGVPRTHPD